MTQALVDALGWWFVAAIVIAGIAAMLGTLVIVTLGVLDSFTASRNYRKNFHEQQR